MQKFSIVFLAAMSVASFGCKKKGGGMGEWMSKSVEMKDAMCKCKDKACADKVQADMVKMATDMTKGMTEDDAKKMAADMTPEDTKKMTDLTMETAKCETAAMGGGAMMDGSAAAGSAAPAAGSAAPAAGSAAPAAGSAAPAAAAAGGGDVPQECQDYKAAIDKLAKCDALPQASRDAMKQGYDGMSAAFASAAGAPPEAKKAMADGCKQGADAIMQAGKAACGW